MGIFPYICRLIKEKSLVFEHI